MEAIKSSPLLHPIVTSEAWRCCSEWLRRALCHASLCGHEVCWYVCGLRFARESACILLHRLPRSLGVDFLRTYAYTSIYTRMHTTTYTHTCTSKYAHTHILTHTPIHIHWHNTQNTHIHKHTLVRTKTCVSAHEYTSTRTRTHAHGPRDAKKNLAGELPSWNERENCDGTCGTISISASILLPIICTW